MRIIRIADNQTAEQVDVQIFHLVVSVYLADHSAGHLVVQLVNQIVDKVDAQIVQIVHQIDHIVVND